MLAPKEKNVTKLTGQKFNIDGVKGINASKKNPFVQEQSIEDTWSSINESVAERNTLWQEDIQAQIQQIESQTKEYKRMLAPQYGKNLNLYG